MATLYCTIDDKYKIRIIETILITLEDRINYIVDSEKYSDVKGSNRFRINIINPSLEKYILNTLFLPKDLNNIVYNYCENSVGVHFTVTSHLEDDNEDCILSLEIKITCSGYIDYKKIKFSYNFNIINKHMFMYSAYDNFSFLEKKMDNKFPTIDNISFLDKYLSDNHFKGIIFSDEEHESVDLNPKNNYIKNNDEYYLDTKLKTKRKKTAYTRIVYKIIDHHHAIIAGKIINVITLSILRQLDQIKDFMIDVCNFRTPDEIIEDELSKMDIVFNEIMQRFNNGEIIEGEV